MKLPKVAIVIVNWNGWRVTLECLDSLLGITYPTFEVIVVDNGSTDDSVKFIRKWAKERIPTVFESFPNNEFSEILEEDANLSFEDRFERRLVIIQAPENLGFSTGNNIGIKRALQSGSDYILLLNNDTVVSKEFLTRLIQHAQIDEKVGILGGKVYYANQKNKLWYAGGTLQRIRPGGRPYGKDEIDRGQYNKVKKVTFVTGAAMLVKSKVFKDIGLLDERFFFGMEDYDFSRRAIRKGYSLLYVPKAIIWHKVGSTRKKIGTSDIYRGYKTSIIYMKKHLPPLVWVFWLFFYSVYLLTLSLFLTPNWGINKRSYRKAIMKAIKDGISDNRVSVSDTEKLKTWELKES